MSKAAVSIFAFGCYIFLNAITLIATPNLLLSVLGLEQTGQAWLRVFGVVLVILAFYYVQAARQEITAFFEWTVWGRPLLPVGLVVLTALGLVPPILLVFGVIDLAGVAWTAAALRSQRAAAA